MATKPPKPGKKWRNRIVGYAQVDPKSLKANPMNWRVHPTMQRKAMGDVFDKLGFVEAAIVNKQTGHILDGHMRVELALEHAEPTVPILYVDMTAEEERLALSILNPMAELAATDPDKLSELLRHVPRSGGPLDELLASLEEQALGAVMKETDRSVTRKQGTTADRTMRMMLLCSDVSTVERVIAATKVANRGEALLMICNAYLGGDDEAEKRDDTGAQGGLASQFDEALAEPTRGPRKPRRPRQSVGAGLS